MLLRQIHGVAGAVQLNTSGGRYQQVRVEDGANFIVLVLSECAFPAGLTPEQARYLGRQLLDAATRFEKRDKEK